MFAHRRTEPAPATAVATSAEEWHSTFERIEHAARLATQSPSRSSATGGGLKSVYAAFLAWRERQFAAGVCRALLRQHDETSTRHPGLAGVPLYRRIIADRHGGSVLVADAIMERASESFAEWPVSRSLNFRDVVHCLIVLEFIAANRGARWIHADLKQFVSDTIPSGL